jgi:peptidoglycan/LPS O-acetylase OafA/YrhL
MPTLFSQTTTSMVRYRKYIDGLRAVAVLPVILYHAGIPFFTGGFVGVDIFFVISGFLITSSLVADLSGNTFSLAAFYERRARRILPALTTVVCFCAIAGSRLLFSDSLRTFSKSALWLSFFSSNIFFKREFGYFDAAANTKPLLHTWSLSVEEQFYVIFPMLLYLGWTYAKKHLGRIVTGLALLSFIASWFGVKHDPTAAFYYIHYREWELALGSILAFAFQPAVDFRLPELSQPFREGFSGLGLIGILAPVFLYTNQTPFPGLSALPPCLGTFLIIWTNSGGSTFVGRLLSTRSVVEVGLMSYSLYLWHWPLLVFAKLSKGDELSKWAGAGVLAMSVAISWVSLHLIERPFRQKSLLPKRKRLLAASFAVLVSTGTMGFAFSRNNGSFQGLSSTNQLLEDPRPVKAVGGVHSKYWPVVDDVFMYSIGDMSKTGILVIGDSYANQWINGLEVFAQRNQVTVHIQATPSCPPLIDTYIPEVDARFHVSGKTRNASFGRILDSIHVNHVILAGGWLSYVENKPNLYPVYNLHVGDRSSSTMSQQREVFSERLEATIRFFNARGCKVWVMLGPPEFEYYVPLKLAILIRKHKPISDSFMPKERWLERREFTREVLAGVVLKHKPAEAAFLDPVELFCSKGQCITVENNRSLYIDKSHLSYFGSIYGSPVFQPVGDELKGTNGPGSPTSSGERLELSS